MTQREKVSGVWATRLEAMQATGEKEGVLEEIVIEVIVDQLAQLGCDAGV